MKKLFRRLFATELPFRLILFNIITTVGLVGGIISFIVSLVTGLPAIQNVAVAASLLVLVQTVALFELTFLVSGPGNQTLVVSLYYAAFASGIRPSQAISAMAVVYMLTTMTILIITLRYVSPTQIVGVAGDAAIERDK